MMDAPPILLVNLVVAVASFVASLSGFGYALVATPFLVLLLPPQKVVPVVMLSATPLFLLLLWGAHRELSPQRIGRWLAGALLGAPVGAYGLASIPRDGMRMLIGGITLAAAVALWLKPIRPFRREGLAMWGAGCLSGLLGGASGMSGPPIILLGLAQAWEYVRFRANLIGYFTVLHLVLLALFGGLGILDGDALTLGGWALPGMLLGHVAGVRLRTRVSQAHFRTLALGLVSLGGILALATP